MFKPRPNNRNISTQHIATLLAQHLQAPAKRSEHFSITYRNIVGRKMLNAFGHPVATGCDMLGIENRTRAHARVQHTRTWSKHVSVMQHPQMLHEKFDQFQIWKNNTQHVATRRNTLQWSGQTRAACCAQQCCDMFRWNVAIVWPGLNVLYCFHSASDRKYWYQCLTSAVSLVDVCIFVPLQCNFTKISIQIGY